MSKHVILSRKDGEGSQHTQPEILPVRCAQGQDDVMED
jgi:hypothetical protein